MITINNKQYKVGIYLRLSKEDERLGESSSITNQRSILLEYINKNNLIFINEYIDDGISGTTFNRSGFKKMLRDIEDKKINMVITKDTSRLGRDHIEFGYYVEKYFPENNIRYVAVCDNIDTFNNDNDMLLFKSAYNDLYVKDISNKIRASLNIKKKNGEFVGAYAPYGYKKDINNKHKLVIDNTSAKIVKKIFNLFINGNSITKISNILTKEKIPIPSIHQNMNRGIKSSLFGIWNNRTITDIITNPTYIGNLTQGRTKKINYKSKKRIHTKKQDWIISYNTCPAIIDENVFNLANNIYKSNKNKMSFKNDLLLKGLIYCHECNHKIGFRTINKDKNKTYGACNYYLKHRIYKACTPHNIKYNILENIILNELDNILSKITYTEFKPRLNILKKELLNNTKEKELNNLKKELSLITIKIDKIYDDKLSNLIDKEMYIRNYNKLITEKKLLETEIKKLSNQQTKEINIEEEFKEFIKNLKKDKRFISNIISKITYSESKNINIYFRITNCNI